MSLLAVFLSTLLFLVTIDKFYGLVEPCLILGLKLVIEVTADAPFIAGVEVVIAGD
jgi:hypothetical protein